MTLALQLLFLGAITFVRQDIPDLGVELEPAAGALAFTYRLADLDGNGQTDLLLPDRIFFQNKRAFSAATSVQCPCPDTSCACDLWKDTLYLRSENHLRVVRWVGREWKTEIEQSLAWPKPERQVLMPAYEGANALRFERFLHDINSDDVPEIVVPDEHGLILYAKGTSGYAEVARLDVFPPLRLKPVQESRLWPDDERIVSFPSREMSCRYNLEANRLSIITREDCPTMTEGLRARYRVKHFVLDPKDSFKVLDAETSEEVTQPFEPHLESLRLNHDEEMDIGGGDWQYSKSSSMPIPIYETRVSTDAGFTFRTLRVTGFKPQQSFIDFNRDGRMDLITETTGLFEGGVRESVARFCTSRDVRHTVQVRLQNEAGRFSDQPDSHASVVIELDSPPARNGLMFARYQAGDLCSIAGHFGGDPNNDLLIQDHPDCISLYLSSASGFEGKPSGTLPVTNVHRFSVTDFDGDGLDDIALHWYDVKENATLLKTQLFLTRQEERP